MISAGTKINSSCRSFDGSNRNLTVSLTARPPARTVKSTKITNAPSSRGFTCSNPGTSNTAFTAPTPPDFLTKSTHFPKCSPGYHSSRFVTSVRVRIRCTTSDSCLPGTPVPSIRQSNGPSNVATAAE